MLASGVSPQPTDRPRLTYTPVPALQPLRRRLVAARMPASPRVATDNPASPNGPLREGPPSLEPGRLELQRQPHLPHGLQPKVDQVAAQWCVPKEPSGFQYSSNHVLARPRTIVRT